MNDYSLFVGLSFTLRMLEAVGTSAIFVIVYSFVGKEFPPQLVGSIFVSQGHLIPYEYQAYKI